MYCCLEPLRQHCIRFRTMQCYPKSIKTTLHMIFFIQSCLELLGQDCIGFLTVQCCPQSIKTTLNIIFSFAILSGTTQITSHRILTYPMLSEEYSYAMLSGTTQTIQHRISTYGKLFFLMQYCLEPLRQHCIGL